MADLVITASSVVPSATSRKSVKTTAAAIAAGETVRLDGDGKLILTDADLSTDCEGIAVCSAASGQPCVYVSLDTALVLGTAVTNGAPIYLSKTAGKLTITLADLTAGATPVIVGVGDGTTTVHFDSSAELSGAEVA